MNIDKYMDGGWHMDMDKSWIWIEVGYGQKLDMDRSWIWIEVGYEYRYRYIYRQQLEYM